MTDTDALIQIAHHVPRWVAPLAIGLTALGLMQALPRQVGLRRALLPSLLLAAFSLQGAIAGFGLAGAVGWVFAALATAASGWARNDLQHARYDAATRRYALPGSLWPLALIASIFVLRFGLGMAGAMQPAMLHTTGTALLVGAALGACSGLFLGRAQVLWTLARRATQPAAATAAA